MRGVLPKATQEDCGFCHAASSLTEAGHCAVHGPAARAPGGRQQAAHKERSPTSNATSVSGHKAPRSSPEMAAALANTFVKPETHPDHRTLLSYPQIPNPQKW